jgi:serine/threonine-protein phosphatase 6 regulatory subunit 3
VGQVLVYNQISLSGNRPVNRKYGFIGHITLLTEQIILSLEHFPHDLIQELVAYVPQPAWDEYVQGPFCDAKAKDAALLGGGKPIVSSISRLGGSRWAKVDEEDDIQNRSPAPGGLKAGEPAIAASPKSLLKGEFKRVPAFRQGPRVYSADFGPPSPPPQDSPQLDSVSQTAHQVRPC